VLGGGSLVQIQRPGQDNLWMMVYEWPRGSGQFVGYQFDDQAQVLQAFGPNWMTEVPWTNRNQACSTTTWRSWHRWRDHGHFGQLGSVGR